jgi:DinB family protein
MKLVAQDLIDELIQNTESIIKQIEEFQQVGEEMLNWKSTPQRWSVLECLEHLNRYGDFYLPEIKKRIDKAEKTDATEIFKSGLLGNYFAESMLPKEKLNKMSTFKSMNPAGSKLDMKVITKFIDQQYQMLDLLNKARTINLQKVKTSISISKWIKLRLGDTFRVVIFHNQRHMLQAKKELALKR